MRTQRWWIILILTSQVAWAQGPGRTAPTDSCPVSPRYCQARAPENGLPHDYPRRAFLMSFRTRCALGLMARLRQRPGGLLNPAFAPRACDLMARFLGATPGEWRAITIAAMRTSQLKTTAVGRQLNGQMHAALSLLREPGRAARPGPLGPEASSLSPQERVPFSPQGSAQLARRARAVRVALERAALRRTGHPIGLATGACTARLRVSRRGRVKRMTRLRCSVEGLRGTFWRAAFLHSPLRLMPTGRPYSVWVRVIADRPEPGLRDGFTH